MIIYLDDVRRRKDRHDVRQSFMQCVPRNSKVELFLKPDRYVSARSLRITRQPDIANYPVGRLTGYLAGNGIARGVIPLSPFCQRYEKRNYPIGIGFDVRLDDIDHYDYDICCEEGMTRPRLSPIRGDRDNLIRLVRRYDSLKKDISEVWCGDRLELRLEPGLWFDSTTFSLEESLGPACTPVDMVFGYFLGNWCEKNGPKLSLFYAEWDRSNPRGIGFEVPWEYIEKFEYHPVYKKK